MHERQLVCKCSDGSDAYVHVHSRWNHVREIHVTYAHRGGEVVLVAVVVLQEYLGGGGGGPVETVTDGQHTIAEQTCWRVMHPKPKLKKTLIGRHSGFVTAVVTAQ